MIVEYTQSSKMPKRKNFTEFEVIFKEMKKENMKRVESSTDVEI